MRFFRWWRRRQTHSVMIFREHGTWTADCTCGYQWVGYGYDDYTTVAAAADIHARELNR